MSMSAKARCASGGLRCEVDVNGRHTIVTDEPQSLGGGDTAPAPHELLPSALASCIATMLALYASKRDWRMGDVVVEVDYDPDAQPRHCDIRVKLPADLSEDQLLRLRRVVGTCPVRRALAEAFSFEETVELAVLSSGRA